MTTLAVNKPRAYELGDENHLPIIANDIVYEGAAVGDNASGYARPLVAGDPFFGFAIEKCDNAGGSAGDKYVKVRRKGYVELAVSGAAITDVGKPVYASDDDTFTYTAGSNTLIGFVKRFVSSGRVVVEFKAVGGVIVPLTDGSTGTASDSIASISDAATKNAIASIAAKLNTLIAAQGN